MSAAELLEKVIKYGADESGIQDRFGNNAELYQICFNDFIDEPNFKILSDAINKKNYSKAFDAAHALKGLAGNLGIIAFYDAISELVESLRAERYENLANEYESVIKQKKELIAALENNEATADLLTDEPIPSKATGTQKTKKKDPTHKKTDKHMNAAIIVILGALLIIGHIFLKVNVDYRENVLKESGIHLIETSNQIKLYIEERIANDWKIARSVGDSIANANYKDDDVAIFEMLQRKQYVWNVSDLMLYTENGYCIYSSGNVEMNDVASDTVDKANNSGKYLSIIDTRLIYTVPLKTQLKFKGSRIVAVSVVQDMGSFLDNMGLHSFDGHALMYLTGENGFVISMLTNENAVSTFNFNYLIQDKELSPLEEGTSADVYNSADTSAAYLLTGENNRDYLVSVPIFTDNAPLRLFYMVPEAVVNNAMNNFSRQLITSSLITTALFAALAFLVFMTIYRTRKRLFDDAILSRDRLFDLLVKNTQNAFALFRIDQPAPSYMSTNASNVIGDEYWTIHKTNAGFEMRNSTNIETDTIRQANEMMQSWDGKTPFRSGYIRNDGTVPPKFFEYQLYPVEGSETDYVAIARDVTQAQEREEAAKNAMELATRANEAKSRFLSNMSHDIRTPMNAIMNMTTFAQENIDQPQKLKGYLHTIRESSEHLLLLINDVMDMSRIESGHTVIASEPIDLRAEMQRQADMIRPLCVAKGQTLITDFSGIRGNMLSGDALKLSQIIINLLSNAVKFTPENGAVRFSVKEIPSLRDDLVSVRFVVEDTGIGISKEFIGHIYEPFARSDDKTVNKIEGTGLGLSICKNYVDAMGGTIKCESEEGEGSTFTVELFFKMADFTIAEHVDDSQMNGEFQFFGMHCLVVEDNAANQLIAKTLLERMGFLVDIADNGSEGADAFISSAPDKYDVIYMDLRMPVLDGYKATEKIRKSKHPRATKVPIIAMTANVFEEDVEKARASGMDAFLAKPIVSFDIMEKTNKAMKIKRG